MPLTPGDAALLGGGMLAAGAATFFYKRKQTLPFKVSGGVGLVCVCVCVCCLKTGGAGCWSTSILLTTTTPSLSSPPPQLAYFVAWPTLGSAIILVGMPSDDKLKRDLQRPPGELAAAAANARAAAAAAANAGRKE